MITLLTLTSCASIDTKLQSFTSVDLSNAAALAASGGDTVGSNCWIGLAGAAAASPAPQDDGLAVLTERLRLFDQQLNDQCASIVGRAALLLLSHLPLPLPFLPPALP